MADQPIHPFRPFHGDELSLNWPVSSLIHCVTVYIENVWRMFGECLEGFKVRLISVVAK